MPVLPDLDDVLGTLRVVALPLVTRFRGITVREAALFEGPEGWTDFAPFAARTSRTARPSSHCAAFARSKPKTRVSSSASRSWRSESVGMVAW